jgi:sortase A
VKSIRALALLLLLAGAGLGTRASYLHAKAQLASFLIHRAWERGKQTGKPHLPWSWADTYPVASLRIPALHYDEIVLEGATPRTLAFGPAHSLSGARFGEAGNLVIVGHRTSWFRPLEKIANNDEVNIQWFDNNGRQHQRRYAVQTIHIVAAKDLSLSSKTSDDKLTLVTCYPFGARADSPQRLVVSAVPLH